MDRNHFRAILRRYLHGRATPEEEKIIDTWYNDMGHDDEVFLEVQRKDRLERKYWSTIHSHIARARTRTLIPWRSVRLAASLLLVGAACVYLLLPDAKERAVAEVETQTPGWELIYNDSGASRRYVLADGSSVTLEHESHLSFPARFSEEERVVRLDGEAFFDVARDEQRPFLVETSQLTTRVLGTSFRVKAFRNDRDVTVAVKTGKVSVSTKDVSSGDKAPALGIILTPNQQIVYDKEAHKLSRTLVPKPEMVVPEETARQMRFEAAPVAEIFDAIQEVYGVELVYDRETFSSCQLTSVISDGDLYKRLEIICNTIGATYSLEENKIVITGRGCNYQ